MIEFAADQSTLDAFRDTSYALMGLLVLKSHACKAQIKALAGAAVLRQFSLQPLGLGRLRILRLRRLCALAVSSLCALLR